jgi:hypothetical protein
LQRWVMAVENSSHRRRKKGTVMEFLVLAIAAVVGLGLFRYLRTRTAH